MCQSYRKACACGEKTAEIFFGRMILDEKAVKEVYCPKCSHGVDTKTEGRVFDNGWVLELNMDVVKCLAPVMEVSPDEITAERVFREFRGQYINYCPCLVFSRAFGVSIPGQANAPSGRQMETFA